LYFYSGVRKPSFEAFRFPLVVASAGRGARVWGISPRSGELSVERQFGALWPVLFSLRVTRGSVFVRAVRPSLRGHFRAVIGGETSLVWSR